MGLIGENGMIFGQYRISKIGEKGKNTISKSKKIKKFKEWS